MISKNPYKNNIELQFENKGFQILLVGATNAGKSTLFNALLGKRKAIVHEKERITRDFLTESFQWENYKISLTDTAGFLPIKEENQLEKKLFKQFSSVYENANLIFYVIDVQNPKNTDAFNLKKLRPYSSKVVLIGNKVDSNEQNAAFFELYRYGFKKILPISKNSLRSIRELKQFILERAQEFYQNKENNEQILSFSENEQEKTEKKIIKVSFIGRPNVGKSTLFNCLLKKELTLVDDEAGTTRDSISTQVKWKEQDFMFIDTAGIKRKNKNLSSIDYLSVNRSLLALKEADIVCFLLEAQEGILSQDKKLMNIALKQGKAILIVVNKIDLLLDLKNKDFALKDKIYDQFPAISFAPVICVSAFSGKGVDKIFYKVYSLYDELYKKVDIHKLNDALKEWNFHFSMQRTGLVKYITQTSVNPVVFRIFYNKKKRLPANYKEFLKNKIHQTFFKNIPITLQFNES